MLNLVLGARAENHEPWSGAADLALWERPPLTAAVDPDFHANGPAAALTWPSRRLRLVHDPTGVTGVLIANGDPLAPQNSNRFEPMTTWRRSAQQEKKSGVVPVYMPRTHDPERSVWRGLEALLPQGVTERQGAEAAGARSSASLDWVRRQTDALGPDYLIRTRAVGMSYGSQSSSTVEILDDSLVMHTGLLSTAELQAAAVDAVRAAEAAVNALGDLARNLAVAAGGEGEGARDQARRMGFFALDGPFRRWLADLDGRFRCGRRHSRLALPDPRILREIGEQLMPDAGPMAFAGRPSALGRHIDAGLAALYFRRSSEQGASIGPQRSDVPSSHRRHPSTSTPRRASDDRSSSSFHHARPPHPSARMWGVWSRSSNGLYLADQQSLSGPAAAQLARLRRGVAASPGADPFIWHLLFEKWPSELAVRRDDATAAETPHTPHCACTPSISNPSGHIRCTSSVERWVALWPGLPGPPVRRSNACGAGSTLWQPQPPSARPSITPGPHHPAPQRGHPVGLRPLRRGSVSSAIPGARRRGTQAMGARLLPRPAPYAGPAGDATPTTRTAAAQTEGDTA